MNPLFRPLRLALAISLLTGINYVGINAASAAKLEEVLIIGNKDDASKLPGSAVVLDETELAKFSYTDIGRILAQVPGVYLRDEDGYGLRPNIGIRGGTSERSKKVTVMEDGVLVAPSPYADPAAYYFPSSGRMSSVEVLKGPGQLRHGPYTVGGAVNLVSTPIPDAPLAGKVQLEAGSNNEARLHTHIGGSSGQFGYLLETQQHQTDGFQDIDRSNKDSGFDKEDYLLKLRYKTADGAALPQQFDLKTVHATEDANTSYLGLTDADFNADENRRYGLSALDNMDTTYDSLTLSHAIQFSDHLTLRSSAYYHDFKRNWFKVDSVNGQNIESVLFRADNGINSGAFPTELAILRGQQDGNFTIKNNARDYYSKGIQFALDWTLDNHVIDAGIRIHEDQMDRYQPTDNYRQINGQLVYQSTGAVSNSNNVTDTADAVSLWLLDEITVSDKLDVTLALRHEEIDGESLQGQTSVTRVTKNVDKWLAGVGATYQLSDNWQAIAGVHKGMVPVNISGSSDSDPEESVNYEGGFRFSTDALIAELIGFYSDYQNSVQNCSQSAQCAGKADPTSGNRQLGEGYIQGFETGVNYTLDAAGLSWPLKASYTWTDGEITEDSDDGATLDGDNYAYVPENQIYLSAGVIAANGWDAYLSATFNDEVCTDNKCQRNNVRNTYRESDRYWVIDAVTHYPLADNTQVYLKLENLTDEQAVASRNPAGARPNKPRTALVGVTYNF